MFFQPDTMSTPDKGGSGKLKGVTTVSQEPNQQNVYSVTSVSLTNSGPNDLLIVAEGMVPSEGWTNPRLISYVYIQPPPDGIWDFNFAADPPSETSNPMLTSITAEQVVKNVPDSFKGVRVHAATNSMVTLRE